MYETQNVADELILYAWEQRIRCHIMVSETKTQPADAVKSTL